MIRRRTISALCVLGALLVGAIAAQSASAATTAFECSKSVTTKTFTEAHCQTTSPGTKEYGHKALATDSKEEKTVEAGATELEISAGPGTFLSGKQVMKAMINGIAMEMVSEGGVSGSGFMKNTEVGGEMTAKTTGTLTFTGITVNKPLGKGCKIFTDNGGSKGEEGVIHTERLSTSTTNEMGLKVTPTAGTVIAIFILSGCTGSAALEGLNGTYTVNGSVTGEPNGGEGNSLTVRSQRRVRCC